MTSLIIGIFYSILQSYFAISIGQLAGKHRILTSIGAYFAINFVIQNIIGFIFIFTNTIDLKPFYIDNEIEIMENIFHYLNTFGLISLVLNTALTVCVLFRYKSYSYEKIEFRVDVYNASKNRDLLNHVRKVPPSYTFTELGGIFFVIAYIFGSSSVFSLLSNFLLYLPRKYLLPY